MSSTSRNIMVIAGEASGDRIASRAIRATKRLAREAGVSVSFYGIGGDECIVEGLEALYHARDMSVVGFVEVARRFMFFRTAILKITSLLDTRRPDVLLLIDYPGFNIRIAKEAKRRGIRVVYYVSPQVWAWHSSRVEELKQIVSEMLVIFPFEEEIYRNAGLESAHFVGHPLVERIEEEKESYRPRKEFAELNSLDAAKKWILVFAGSRTEEVRRLLPVMSRAAVLFAKKYNYEAILVESESIDASHYTEYLQGDLRRFRKSALTHELMYHADLGILKSGTTTLEAALLGLPGVIGYKTHPLTFAIGKRLVKLPFIGLANIVLRRKLYPELLQSDLTETKIIGELERIESNHNEFLQALEGLALTLQKDSSGPSQRVAESLLRD